MHSLKHPFKKVFGYIYTSYIPNKNDNLKQLLLKCLFIIFLATLIFSSIKTASYFLTNKKEDTVVADTQKIWHAHPKKEKSEPISKEAERAQKIIELKKANSDFVGWLTLPGTAIDHPIYKADNNDYYLNHNSDKKPSRYGAIFLDYQNEISYDNPDQNLVIFGHNMKNGTMFGTLKKTRSLAFYKDNPLIEFTTAYGANKYRIYAVFVLNANRNDDNGNIYNIYKKSFNDQYEFNDWVEDARERSLLKIDVDVNSEDEILTLVTCCSDFKDARLVVMARKVRSDENSDAFPFNVEVNPKPKYPDRWYKDKNIKNPYAVE